MIEDLEKQPGSIPIDSIQWDSSWPVLSDDKEREFLFSYLETRFGIPVRIFDDYLLFKKRINWWLLRKTELIHESSHLKTWMVGLKAFQQVGQYIKPTTRMIQVFGHSANRSIWEIGKPDLKTLISGDQIPSDMEIENGYVILSLKGIILGLGLLIDGAIISQIPKKDVRFLTY